MSRLRAPILDPDRLFPPDPRTRRIARRLFAAVEHLPLFCPHTHIDAGILAENRPFPDPLALFVTSDHYVLRMLMSQGVRPEQLGLPRRPPGGGGSADPGDAAPADPRTAWRTFVSHWHVFRGTPTRMWIEDQLVNVFGVEHRLDAASADATFDRLGELLARPEFRPRALFDRFAIELLATTDPADRPLAAHAALAADPWPGRVIPTFRPDRVVDADAPGWADAVRRLAAVASVDTSTFDGYLEALCARRASFVELGAVATDHGPRLPLAARSPLPAIRSIYRRALAGPLPEPEADRFRAHMLMEFAAMSADDGLVMQIHPGSLRDHDRPLFEAFGPDLGADIPIAVDFVNGLRELLNDFGNRPGFTLVVFTLDEAALSRELAPMAAHYPALRIGAPWWFFDSPDAIRRHRDAVTATAGFYNGAGFNDDARCFTSIPARHDMSRRVDSGYLAGLVADGRIEVEEALELGSLLALDQARELYRIRSVTGPTAKATRDPAR